MTEEKKYSEQIYFLLKKHWHHAEFRSLQREIIFSVLEKKDTLALLPTGGGKSLCFQIPGLIQPGITLVISPLISLMNDQVENLNLRGIASASITSAMNFREIDFIYNQAASSKIKFLYISPERLQSNDFRTKVSYLPVSLIAVDEAHCISQWGYDFRPSYLKISELRTYFPSVNIIALTASATNEVCKDILTKLEFKSGNIFRQSFERKNLRYVVQFEENKYVRLLKLIKSLGGSGIVYVRNRKKTEEISNYLIANSISSGFYHAGMTHEARKNVQKSWTENKVQVICATNAFGMGIDKSDVRFVVHLDLPESIEAYFQEAGRAGRDGKNSYSVILYSNVDKEKLLNDWELSFPEIDSIKNVYQALSNYFQIQTGSGLGSSFPFNSEVFSNKFNLLSLLVYNSIKFLEKENYLSLIDTGFEPSKVMIKINKEDLYDFEIRFPKYEPLIKTMLRSYGGMFENYVVINENQISYRVKLSIETVKEFLIFLDKQNIISYLPQNDLPKIIFLNDRIDSMHIKISKENYDLLKKNYLKRIQSVINYVSEKTICRSVQLLNYFSESDYSECGHCDICLSKKSKDDEDLKAKIIQELNSTEMTISQLNDRLRIPDNEKYFRIVNELIDDGILSNKENTLHLVRSMF